MKQRLRDAAPLLAIVLAALALRLAWVWYAEFEPTLSDDAGRYDFLGQALAHGRGYTNPNGATTLFWPPGYPFILAGVYRLSPDGWDVTAALAANALFGALTVAAVYGIGRRALGETPALIAAAITALFPSLIMISGTTLTETAFTSLALGALLAAVEAHARRSWPLFVVAAILCGVATLIRGQALLFALVLVPLWLASGTAWRGALLRAAAFGALTVAVGAPWTVRNYVESGALVPIATNAGVDFYIGHSEGADGRGRIVDELVFRYPELPPAEAEAKVSRDGTRDGLEYAFTHPLEEARLSARKVFFLYWRDDEALAWNEAHGERRFLSDGERVLWAAVSNVYWYAVLVGALSGAVLAFKRRNAVVVLLLTLTVYWTLVHVAFFADPRFHAPIAPVLALLAAGAWGVIRPLRPPA